MVFEAAGRGTDRNDAHCRIAPHARAVAHHSHQAPSRPAKGMQKLKAILCLFPYHCYTVQIVMLMLEIVFYRPSKVWISVADSRKRKKRMR